MGWVGAFDEQVFRLGGDPVAIGGSAGLWSAFGGGCSDTAGDLRVLDAGEFTGDEADLYRQRISGDLPPYLDTTSQAWSQVGGALLRYSAVLADMQARMQGLRSTAWQQWSDAAAADDAADRARADDAAHAADRRQQQDALQAGQSLPPDTYRAAGPDARNSADASLAAYRATMSNAAALRDEHARAVDDCARAIDAARDLRFADPPSWFGRLWEKACDWVADHIDVLQALSAVLKQISSIAGTLAMIPFLAPIAGPIAVGAGGLALGIDATIKVTTGQGNWTDIALTGLSMIPGARAARLSTIADTTYTGYQVVTGQADIADLAYSLAGTAAAKNAGKHLGPSGKNNALPSTKTSADWMETKRERLARERTPEAEERARQKREALASHPPDSHLESGVGVRYTETAVAVGDDWATVTNLENSQGREGLDVIAHGYTSHPNGELGYFDLEHPTHPAQIAEAVRQHPRWPNVERINLVTCGGSRGAAQALADELGIPVYAARNKVALDSEGRNVERIRGRQYEEWRTGTTLVPTRAGTGR